MLIKAVIILVKGDGWLSSEMGGLVREKGG
jgi:hypothetical protein